MTSIAGHQFCEVRGFGDTKSVCLRFCGTLQIRVHLEVEPNKLPWLLACRWLAHVFNIHELYISSERGLCVSFGCHSSRFVRGTGGYLG